MNIKAYTFLLALTFLFLFLTGFSLGGFVDDMRFKGTSIGITKCMERNIQEGVPKNLIKQRCINEHQKQLKNDVLAVFAEIKPSINKRGISNWGDRKTETEFKNICIDKDIEFYCSEVTYCSHYSLKPDKKNSCIRKCKKEHIDGYIEIGPISQDPILSSCEVFTQSRVLSIFGKIKNQTKNIIVTSFEIHISHHDNFDPDVNGIKQIIPHKVWILPNQEMSAGDETQINYEPRRDRLSLFNLKIKNIRGVEFILK